MPWVSKFLQMMSWSSVGFTFVVKDINYELGTINLHESNKNNRKLPPLLKRDINKRLVL